MTTVRLNKICSPSYAGPFPVGECRCTGVGPRPNWNIQVYIVSEKCRIYVAVSPDNMVGCDGQKLGISMIWQHF